MKQIYTEELLRERIQPIPEQRHLLVSLKKMGYQLGLASNCTRPTVDLVLSKLEIQNFFDVILSRDDVYQPKPSSEIYEKCVHLLKTTPEKCLIVEDSRPGILAAQKVSPNVVVVKRPSDVTLSFIEQALQECSSQNSRDTRIVEVVIPMAGLGSRFSEAGYQEPKPLIPIDGKPMIQWVIENLNSKKFKTHFNFIVNRNHLINYKLEEKLSELAPGCNIISIPGKTEGAACTVMLALDQVPLNRPLIIANSDQFVATDFDEFLKMGLGSNLDGLIMTFPATESKWSYAKLNSHGLVSEVAEKRPISEHATVGIYYFKTAELYLNSSESMIRANKRTNGEFYVCPVYNELIQTGAKVGIHPISANSMHGLGTPEDLTEFKKILKTPFELAA